MVVAQSTLVSVVASIHNRRIADDDAIRTVTRCCIGVGRAIVVGILNGHNGIGNTRKGRELRSSSGDLVLLNDLIKQAIRPSLIHPCPETPVWYACS